MSNGVDIFADLDSATDPNVAPETLTEENTSDSAETPTDVEENSAPVEILSSIPDGTVSVTEFASMMTTLMIKNKVLAGEELDGSEYVVPQSVYQTVKAAKDRIPHVLVKTDEDKEPKTYILTEEATAWWLVRRDKLATRGSGAKSASSRTPDDNLALLGQAVVKKLYADSRLTMWKTNLEQADKLVEKYRGFLTDAKVTEEVIASAIQEATDEFEAEQKAKADEKAAKKAAAKATAGKSE